MSSLSELLSKISDIPQEELKPGKTKAERPTEMGLICQVLSEDEIERSKTPNTQIKRACYRRNHAFEMEFRISNAGFHKVVASYGSQGLQITNNNRPVSIGDSVEEFRRYLLGLTQEAENKAGAS